MVPKSYRRLLLFWVLPLLLLAPIARAEGSQLHIGLASWYGGWFNGHRAAGGELYNQNRLTAASRTLPLGTPVRVTNLRNGRSVVVRINDRGPYVRGRMIDLSRAAARELGMLRQGTAWVLLEVVPIAG